MSLTAQQIKLSAEFERLKATVNELAELTQNTGCLSCVHQYHLTVNKLNKHFRRISLLRKKKLESEGITEAIYKGFSHAYQTL